MDTLFPQLHVDDDRVALSACDRTLHYSALTRACARHIEKLAKRGVQPGDRIAVWTEPGVETLIALVAQAAAGYVTVPIDPKLGTKELAHVLSDAAPRIADSVSVDLRYGQDLRTLELAALEVTVPAPPAAPAAPLSAEVALRFDWATETAIHVGTITHRWLQRIGEEGIERWGAERIAALAPAIERDLERRGIPASERAAAATRVARALATATADERGRWILGAHPRSHFEYRVRVATPEGVRLYVMDRMFTEASGRCWIVDYKVSLHEGSGAEAFLDRELERYAPQLARYVSAFSRDGPRAALYFPLMGGWRVLTDPAEVRG